MLRMDTINHTRRWYMNLKIKSSALERIYMGNPNATETRVKERKEKRPQDNKKENSPQK